MKKMNANNIKEKLIKLSDAAAKSGVSVVFACNDESDTHHGMVGDKDKFAMLCCHLLAEELATLSDKDTDFYINAMKTEIEYIRNTGEK